VSQIGRDRLHFDAAVNVVRNASIFRLERSRDFGDMAAEVSAIIAHARHLPGP
jgi:hypothetical protein